MLTVYARFRRLRNTRVPHSPDDCKDSTIDSLASSGMDLPMIFIALYDSLSAVMQSAKLRGWYKGAPLIFISFACSANTKLLVLSRRNSTPG